MRRGRAPAIRARASGVTALAALAFCAAPAAAGEIFGGVYAHNVETPLTARGLENGADLQLGWRGGRIAALQALGAPSPHVYGLVNTNGDTSFASAGLSWRFGGALYLRPGIGLAIHDGPSRSKATGDRVWFGSRILFAPELGAGVRLSERSTIEASWVHFSHAQLFGRQNPGSDQFGIRLNYRY
jgi:lipid A 3-O-deacylase